MQEDVSPKLRAFEREVAHDVLETLLIMRPNGTEVLRRQGERDRVAFDGIPRDQVRGAIMSHNHPGGTSFSKQDVETAIAHRVLETRVVTVDAVYVMRIPDWVEWDDIEAGIDYILEDLLDKDRDAFHYQGADMVELARSRMHRAWVEFTEGREWHYERIAR